MASVPTLSEWLAETAGGMLDRRNANLKAVDDAIARYHSGGRAKLLEDEVRRTLSIYISDHQNRKGGEAWKSSIRNRKGGVEKLWKALETPPSLPPVTDEVLRPLSPKPTPQVPRAAGFDAGFQRHLSKVLEARVDYARDSSMARRDADRNRIERVKGALTSAETAVQAVMTKVTFRLTNTGSTYRSAMTAGYAVFKTAYDKEAEKIDFKVGLVKAAFEAIGNLAPPPINIIGKVGAAIAGQFKTDRYVNEFMNTSAVAARGELSTLEKMSAGLSSVAEDVQKATTLNPVSTSKIQSFHSMVSQFEDFFNTFNRKVMVEWDVERKKWGVGPEQKEERARQLLDTQSLNKMSADHDCHLVVQGIETDYKAVDAYFKNLSAEMGVEPTTKAIAKWIVVRLVADYALEGLREGKAIDGSTTAEELADLSFGDPYAELMASTDFEIVELRTGDLTTQDIFARGHIPWTTGGTHPVQTIAMFLFLDWVRKAINPFEALSNPDRLREFDDKAKAQIRKIGLATDAHRERRFLRNDYANVGEVVSDLRR